MGTPETPCLRVSLRAAHGSATTNQVKTAASETPV